MSRLECKLSRDLCGCRLLFPTSTQRGRVTRKCYCKLDPGSDNCLCTVWDPANASLLLIMSLNKFQWNMNQNTTIFIHENAFKILSTNGGHLPDVWNHWGRSVEIIVVMEGYDQTGNLSLSLASTTQIPIMILWLNLNQHFNYVELVEIMLQAAKGMEHLESRNVLHRDVAARNCM